ncbi:putative phosphoglycerate mutase [Apodospora peruviana]|uniref:Phosphoglycerate mutase n=1 Tax=Apodospora peruviana TaxID=516989 RepID=A0AAE0IS82_9PEZI|nr:putative phosphoglycerate mutase [Apodospora peruviana]
MSRDADNLTPRVFFFRHGETEWAKLGRQTGVTDVPLTEHGIEQVTPTATHLVGTGKLVDPERVVRVFVSPRERAQQTLQCLFPEEDLPIYPGFLRITDGIAEWDYGDYEGLTAAETKALRKEWGLDAEQEWSVWRDGCEGGESMQQVTRRLDRLISEIQDIQWAGMEAERPADIVLLSHGLILRAFVKRWLSFPVDMQLSIMLAPGAMGILTYKNNNIDEPAIHVGLTFP